MEEVLRVHNLSKKFKKKQILKNVNLSINKGDIAAVIGGSGSGKSVLLKTIIGFLKPNKGSVTLNEVIGFSAQSNSIYENLTVKQNLHYFSEMYEVRNRKEAIENLIDVLQLDQYRNVHVRNLSGGTAKRVDIACALLENPEILVLDEPFTGLDFLLVERLSIFLKKLQKIGTTIIISSHKLNQVENLCNKFFLMSEGSATEITLAQFRNLYPKKVR